MVEGDLAGLEQPRHLGRVARVFDQLAQRRKLALRGSGLRGLRVWGAPASLGWSGSGGGRRS